MSETDRPADGSDPQPDPETEAAAAPPEGDAPAPPLAFPGAVKVEPQRLFDDAGRRRSILGYLSGLGAALLFGLAVLCDASEAPRYVVLGLYISGVGLLLPALFHSLFWRIAASLVAVAVGVRYGLEIRGAVSHYGMVKQTFDAMGEEVRYGLVDVLSPTLSAFLCVLFASLVSYWDLQEARQNRNFPVLLNGVLTVVLALMAFGLTNFIASQRGATFDWSGTGVYTLSAESKAQMRSLPRPVWAHLFVAEGSEEYGLIKQLLTQYVEAGGGRITLVPHDPLRDADDFQVESQRLGLTGGDFRDMQCVAFETRSLTAGDASVKDRVEQVSLREMFRVRLSGPRRSSRPVFEGEEAFTNAILELQEDGRPKVYVLTGHGELSAESQDPSRGCSKLVEALQRRNFDVQEQPWGPSAPLPDADGVLIIGGPRQPLTEPERTALAAWLDKGGRALIALEPKLAEGDGLVESDLAGLLEPYGIAPSRHLIAGQVTVRRLDQAAEMLSFGGLPFPGLDTEHPITRPLAGGALVATEALALRREELPEGSDVVATTLVAGGKDYRQRAVLKPVAFRDGTLNPGDLIQGFALAIAAERAPEGKPATRLVVTGDSDILANGSLDRGSNLTFALNALNWLAEREGRFVAEAKAPPTYSLEIPGSVKIALQLAAIFLLPAMPLSMGLLMVILRRS